MAEVISMEEFKKSAGELCEDCGGPLTEHDDIERSWDWAQEKSRQLVLKLEVVSLSSCLSVTWLTTLCKP